jgi:hypothetical protein
MSREICALYAARPLKPIIARGFRHDREQSLSPPGTLRFRRAEAFEASVDDAFPERTALVARRTGGL